MFEVVAIVARICKVCPTCVEAEERVELDAWKAQEIAGLERTIADKIVACGFGQSECAADLAKVPVGIKRMIPRDEAATLLGAERLTDGFVSFGLIGGQGIGKTMCLAAMMRARTAAVLRAAIEGTMRIPDGTEEIAWHDVAFFRWINWPETAAWMKTTAMEDHGSRIIEGTVQRWIGASIVIIDDIGRERMSKGGYDEDLATGALDRVIDARSRAHSATLWTSNLTRSGINARYGAALTSRLLGMAPAIEVAKLPDLRLRATA